MIFVGNDWAEDHHDVYLMDEGEPAWGPGVSRKGSRVWPACMRWSPNTQRMRLR